GQNECFELVHGNSDFLADAIWKTGGQKSVAEPGNAGYLKPAAIEKRAGASRTAEQFIPPRVVDGAAHHFTGLLKRDRNAKKRILVGEVGGAVKRIDNPLPAARAQLAGFFSEDGVIRIPLTNAADDERFAFP